MDYERLGKNIRKYRLLREMKQEQLAERVGCTASHIGQIENNRGVPSLETVILIANALKVTPDQLLMDLSEVQELVYLRELEARIQKLPTATKIMACEALNGLLDIVEQLHQ